MRDGQGNVHVGTESEIAISQNQRFYYSRPAIQVRAMRTGETQKCLPVRFMQTGMIL